MVIVKPVLLTLGAPNELFCKKLFYSGYFAGKIVPVLCVADKMKYICWETFQKTFVKSGHYHHETEKSFVELRRIFENLLKFMDVSNEMHKTQVMQLAGKNISAIFLGVKNTF